jgi:hypothetical protein
MHGNIQAGESTPNVTGKCEGNWSHRAGSGQITIRLAQEGTQVRGKQSVVGVTPVLSGDGSRQILIGQEVRDGHLEGSTLIFHVIAESIPRQVNFTLRVSGDVMTGTACRDTCTTLKLKKSAF